MARTVKSGMTWLHVYSMLQVDSKTTPKGLSAWFFVLEKLIEKLCSRRSNFLCFKRFYYKKL